MTLRQTSWYRLDWVMRILPKCSKGASSMEQKDSGRAGELFRCSWELTGLFWELFGLLWELFA